VTAQLVGTLAVGTAAVALVLAAGLRDPAPPAVSLPHPDAPELMDAGWRGGLRRWEAIRAAVALSVALAALATGIPIAAAIPAALAPSVWIRLRASAARDRARRGLGPLVATAEGALRSGASLPDALRRSVEAAGDPLATRPIAEALRAFDLGAGLDTALLVSAGGARDARGHLALGTIALGVAERLPRERLADLLAVVVDRLSFDARLDDEVRARAAGVRQQQLLLAALVPAIATYLTFTMPTLAVTLSSDLGRFVLIPAALGLELAGILLGRRVVRAAVR
jgi:Flp pilus assembly protein TadB